MKPIKQLVPDLQKAIRAATKESARKISFEVRNQGPYWTGTFYKSITIVAGTAQIPRTTQPPTDIPNDPKSKPAVRAAAVPATKLTFKGSNTQTAYSIGSNILDEYYVGVATDLIPGREKKKRRTAPLNWFTSFMAGIDKDVKIAFDGPMRKAGF